MGLRGRRRSQGTCGKLQADGTRCTNAAGCRVAHAPEIGLETSTRDAEAREVLRALMGDDMPEIGDSDPVSKLTDREIQTLSQFVLDRDHRAISSVDECHAQLASAPGVDPVLAAADGFTSEIPDSGWLIKANVAPGGSGVIETYRYASGGIEFRDVSDHRDKYESVRAYYELNDYKSWHMGYEDPDYPAKETDPCERMSPTTYLGARFDDTAISALVNGGRLFEPPPMTGGSGLFLTMDWWSRGNEKRSNHAHVNRAVGSIEEVNEVMSHITAGMGLSDDDALTIMATVKDKIAEAT